MIDDTGNGNVCVMCTEGHWCDKKHEFDCPNGTTSQAGSRSEMNCYCTPGYNGSGSNSAINCEERTYATHSPCNVGYFYNANGTCHICSPGDWCDGEEQKICDRGLSSPSGSSSSDDCTCSPGVNRSECSATVTFTVTLGMTIEEFDLENQTRYIATVARTVSVPVTSVYIDITSESTPIRRLLSSRTMVQTTIIVQEVHATSAITNAMGVQVALNSDGMPAESMSTVTVVYINTVKNEEEPDNTLMIILAVSACLIIIGGIAAFVYVKIHGDSHKYEKTQDVLPYTPPPYTPVYTYDSTHDYGPVRDYV